MDPMSSTIFGPVFRRGASGHPAETLDTTARALGGMALCALAASPGHECVFHRNRVSLMVGKPFLQDMLHDGEEFVCDGHNGFAGVAYV